jgi:serine/threonine protein phosphatase 1
MPARTIAIGDMHGCAAALDALLEAMDITSEDTLVTLGDYVDRGPHSREVIARLIELQRRCRLVPLLGNHEAMMLESLAGGDLEFWLTCGGFDTVQSYDGGIEKIPPEHIEFLEACRRHWQCDSHFFVHANYRAELSLASQPEHAVLWEHLHFHVPKPHVSGKVAIVGHTPQRSGEILDLGHVKCIDTYCIGGKWLTALDVHTGQQWQASAGGELRG